MGERLEPTDERALAERAQREPAAFEALYRQYLPRVYGYVAACLPERGQAEDLVATIFLRALERLDQFRFGTGVAQSIALFKIAANTA